jgi:hypothetical protein
MKPPTKTMAAALVAGVLALGACSGAPGGDVNEPAGAANAAMAATEVGGLTALTAFMCAANRDDVAEVFGGGNMGDLTSAGIDPAEIFAALKIDFQDVTVSEVSKSASEATVHLKGKMAMTFDEAKMREIIRKVFETQGVEATDQMIDLAMSTMASTLSQTQDLDSDMQMVQENGKWVICQS